MNKLNKAYARIDGMNLDSSKKVELKDAVNLALTLGYDRNDTIATIKDALFSGDADYKLAQTDSESVAEYLLLI